MPCGLLLLLLNSCVKNENQAVCRYEPTGFDYEGNTATIIPINTRNFWLYADSSLAANGSGVSANPDFLITARNAYTVDGRPSVSFNQFLPQLTISGDTLFATEQTPDGADCFRLHPYLFKVNDTTAIDSVTKLFPSAATCLTPAGAFSDNIIYQSGTAFRMIVHPGTGVVKVEMGNRILFLKSYRIY